MNIVHCTVGSPRPDAMNGVEKSVYHLILAQSKQGHKVSLISMADRDSDPIGAARVFTFKRSPIPFALTKAITRLLAELKPDVLHLHSPYLPENVAFARWARAGGVPYVVTPHGALARGEMSERGYLKLPYKYLYELRTLNRSSFVHEVGAHEGLREYGVTAPIVRVPNGLDSQILERKVKPEELRRWFGLHDLSTIFLFIGRLAIAQKGLDLLVRAMKDDGLSDAALIISGTDWRGGQRKLERLVRNEGLSERVAITDPVMGDEKIARILGADVFCLPSRWEGLPHAALEASGLGLPLLVSAASDPLDRLAPAGGAIRVEADVASVAEGLKECCRMSKSARRKMGETGRKIVRAEFRWDSIAEDVVQAYRHYGAAVRDESSLQAAY